MKPLPIVFTIIGASIVLVVGMTLKSNADRSRLEDQVKAQLSEVRAMGFATTPNEYKKNHEIDKADAWWDLKDYLSIKTPYDPSTKTFDPRSLMTVAGPDHIKIFQTYLKKSQAARTAILTAIKRKKPLTIPESIFGSPPNVDQTARTYVQDFVVGAIADAYSNNKAEIRQNLNAAAYLANSLARETTVFYGTSSWQATILPGALRILEIDPSASAEIESFLSQPDLIAKVNSKKIYELYFLIALNQIQGTDSPLIDRAGRPKWLQSVIHTPSIDEIKHASKDKSDGYIPKSALCLSAYKQALNRWIPVIARIRQGTMPTKAEYDRTNEPFVGMDKDLSDVLVGEFGFFYTDLMDEGPEVKTLAAMVSRVLAIKRKTGGFPKGLGEIVSSSNVKNVAYHNNGSGFSVNTVETDPSTGALVARKKITFPTGDRIAPRTLAKYREQLKLAKEGKLDVLHPETKTVPAKTPTVGRKPTK